LLQFADKSAADLQLRTV